MTFTQCQLLCTTFHGMCRVQPSSPGTPSPSSVKATLQQPPHAWPSASTGQAAQSCAELVNQEPVHAVTPQWTVGDFAWGRPRPSTVSASSMSSQRASETCSASAVGKMIQNAAHPAVSSSAQIVVSHSDAQQCSESAGQDIVQDAAPQYTLMDFALGKPVPGGVRTSSLTSIQHASGPGAKLSPQASASGTIPPADDASAQTAQISHTTAQTCTKTNAHDKRSLANDAASNMSSQQASEMSSKPSERQPAEEKASGTGQSVPVNSQAASDIRTDPTRQVAFAKISLADNFPPLDTLRQTEQPAAKKSTRHSPIAHGASAYSQKSQASSKKSGNKKRADAANNTSSTSLRARDPQVIAQATTAAVKGATAALKDGKATSAPDKGPSAPVHGATGAVIGATTLVKESIKSAAALAGEAALSIKHATAPAKSATAATKIATAFATEAALPTKHATAPGNISTAVAIEAAPSSKSSTASGRAAKAPIKVLTVVKGAKAPAKDTTAVVVGATAPVKGAAAPVKGATAPVKGVTAPVKVATAPVKGVTAPVKGATAPYKGATAPVKGANLKDARGARERNTQASALDIASSSSATPTAASTDVPAAKTSSTSPNLPDPNARAFHRLSSDSSDEFHSASSDAVELSSSRLSPHSSPSQASTGSSYTTARSQTSSTDQASNHHSQLACMTSAAAAPAAVSSSTQGVKQSSMAPMKVPVPHAEQRHNANAKRDQVSQVGQHSSRPPVRSQTVHVEPEQPAQAERQCMPQGGHQINAPSQVSHLASAEPRQYAQAERDPMSQRGQHASRPLDRVRSVTAEPGHDAQAEHQTRPQGCKHTSTPCISPQTENIKPIKDAPAESDSMSSMHPGVESGVDPSEPSVQAGLDEQVHSLDDTLSNALQELLLTEDRQDFAQSIQVGCNMKHICFLHMPQKVPLISFLFSQWLRGKL